MKLLSAFGVSDIGGRANNEDHIFPVPAEAGPDTRLFLVCDGVGGSSKGEEASRLVCESVSLYFRDNPVWQVDAGYITAAVRYAEQALSAFQLAHPESVGMGTTLTLAAFHAGGCTIGWCGDSRVYQVRQGRILFRTEDHSLVEELVRQGVLSPHQAQKHPQRNVILRCLTGTAEPAQVDVEIRRDIQAGDYFFLCTDGVLEVITDELLEDILGDTQTDHRTKFDALFERCYRNTRDNFSFYLIPVG
ncbi:PP2C family protein-serine/threonine phosphatase [Larkinella soli]|uniref:PP2C family protein-serine/threonine phosphatase n=1 Tax=Larkinella soli TaxID=1770527 RepID=UPI000FFC9007|nr:protein phosphatase 2C domain-containing protein [Larkinella soli]